MPKWMIRVLGCSVPALDRSPISVDMLTGEIHDADEKPLRFDTQEDAEAFVVGLVLTNPKFESRLEVAKS